MKALQEQIARDRAAKASKRAATFKLDPELIDAIEKTAARLGVTKATVVRAALRLVLLSQTGIFGGSPDVF